MSGILQSLLKNRTAPSAPRGIYSVCTAHPLAIRAALRQAKEDHSPLLLEATSNQVNQFGGYTGMRPKGFRSLVQELAKEEGFAFSRIILGGDHLGPNPWRTKSAMEAMKLAEEMIAEYAAEGFTKLHLDASMACKDDPKVLPSEVVAERSAQLCVIAEQSAPATDELLYVIGTEVPTPGGATEEIDSLRITSVTDADETLAVHRREFAKNNLQRAWQRVIAMVVQPGVEFNHDAVHDYQHGKTTELRTWLGKHTPMVFEAHSTDYQRSEAYRYLVNDGFAILKVGPAVTFAMREAFFALAEIEQELVSVQDRSHLPQVLEDTMLAAPAEWKGHYHGSFKQQHILRAFSYSDRIRYYWNAPEVQYAVNKLLENLAGRPIPETLLSAYMPVQYRAIRKGSLAVKPLELILHASRTSLQPYATACFGDLK